MEKQNKITGNEPANPHGAWGQQTGTGLTIRQHFAAINMAQLLSNTELFNHVNFDLLPAAEQSVKAADALIKELNKNL